VFFIIAAKIPEEFLIGRGADLLSKLGVLMTLLPLAVTIMTLLASYLGVPEVQAGVGGFSLVVLRTHVPSPDLVEAVAEHQTVY
jgi:hypothetical protein